MTDPKTLEELKDEWDAACVTRDAYYKALDAQENSND